MTGPSSLKTTPHGFVWPDGLPPCAMCDRDANDPIHVNPLAVNLIMDMARLTRTEAKAETIPGTPGGLPAQSHPYQPQTVSIPNNVQCVGCGGVLNDSIHTPGIASGHVPGLGHWSVRASFDATLNEEVLKELVDFQFHEFDAIEENSVLCSACGFGSDDALHKVPIEPLEAGEHTGLAKEVARIDVTERETRITDDGVPRAQAFFTQVGNRLVMAAPASVDIPRELASRWEKASAESPHNLWIAGRFVEGDRPNRNGAYWTTGDLELGAPTVAHGPLNWLHDERHIVGALAGAELVKNERQAASDVGNHIVAMAAVWPYIWPMESRAIRRASDDGRLFYSMECQSREVACLTDGCDHTSSYRDYMVETAGRCEHLKTSGSPRRFADPFFMGGAVIIPPTSPAWGSANAKIMSEAASLAERQAASFADTDLTTSETELLVASLISGGIHA